MVESTTYIYLTGKSQSIRTSYDESAAGLQSLRAGTFGILPSKFLYISTKALQPGACLCPQPLEASLARVL